MIGVEEGQGEAKENERAKEANKERKLHGEPELPLPIPTYCKGAVEKPEATAGNLCVFVQKAENVNVVNLAMVAAGDKLISTTGVLTNIGVFNFGEAFSGRRHRAVTAK